MRVAFVSLNDEDMPEVVVPVGLLYVAANLHPRHERHLLDLRFEPSPCRAVRKHLRSYRPDVVAFGLRNVTTHDYAQSAAVVERARRIVAAAREVSTAPVVIGGGGFSVMPEQLMRRLRPDYGIVGEAERSFDRLVDALEASRHPQRGALDAIPGLWWHSGRRPVQASASSGFADLDALQPPARQLLDPRYLGQPLTDSVQTKRGCSLRCDYCTYPLIEGRTVRTREPSRVVDEMFAALATHPEIAHFFVVDAVFNRPPEHAKAVCRELVRRGWSIPWTCYANPIGFDRELAELMREAACAGIEVGSDSGCDPVLRRLRKGFTTADIEHLRACCREAGLPDCHTFVLGTSSESLEDVAHTLDFVERLDPFAAVFMLYTDDRESLSAELAEQQQRTRDRIAALLRERRREEHPWVIPALGLNYYPRLFRRLRRAGLGGPLWQHLYALGGVRKPQDVRTPHPSHARSS